MNDLVTERERKNERKRMKERERNRVKGGDGGKVAGEA